MIMPFWFLYRNVNVFLRFNIIGPWQVRCSSWDPRSCRPRKLRPSQVETAYESSLKNRATKVVKNIVRKRSSCLEISF